VNVLSLSIFTPRTPAPSLSKLVRHPLDRPPLQWFVNIADVLHG